MKERAREREKERQRESEGRERRREGNGIIMGYIGIICTDGLLASGLGVLGLQVACSLFL